MLSGVSCMSESTERTPENQQQIGSVAEREQRLSTARTSVTEHIKCTKQNPVK